VVVEHAARRHHPVDDRLDGALERAVGGVLGDRQVDLVGDRQRDERLVRGERSRRAAHEAPPGVHVALLRGARVIPDLRLDRVAAPGVDARAVGEAADAVQAVGHEEAVEPDDQRPARRPQRRQRGEPPAPDVGQDLALPRPDRSRELRGDPEPKRLGRRRGSGHLGAQARVPGHLRARGGGEGEHARHGDRDGDAPQSHCARA
jgi:hypothetical protein